MTDIIVNKEPNAFYCPHCKTKIKPDDEKEEEYDESMHYCDHVVYSFTSEGIEYLSAAAERELIARGFNINKEYGIEIDNPKDEDLGVQDLPEILGSKNIQHYQFSYSSMWGLQINIGLRK